MRWTLPLLLLAAPALAQASPGSVPQPLTPGEADAFRVSVAACWNIDALSAEGRTTVVTVAMSLDRAGVPLNGTIRMVAATGASDAANAEAFQAARRAILRCGRNGFALPPEKHDQWRDVELVFNPEGMRLR